MISLEKTFILIMLSLLMIFSQIVSANETISKNGRNKTVRILQDDLDALLNKKNFVEKLNEGMNQAHLNNPEKTQSTEKSTEKHKIFGPINQKKITAKKSNKNNNLVKRKIYWDTLHALESSSGNLIYKKGNKAKSCKWTHSPCGHHQLSYLALKEIGCTSLKCRKAREDFDQSLNMSKKFDQITSFRLHKRGYKNLPEYQQYLAHQQGVYGIINIMEAASGKNKLNKKSLIHMSANSPYSFRYFKRAGSRKAARQFLEFWKEKWEIKQSRLFASR